MEGRRSGEGWHLGEVNLPTADGYEGETTRISKYKSEDIMAAFKFL